MNEPESVLKPATELAALIEQASIEDLALLWIALNRQTRAQSEQKPDHEHQN